MAGLPTARPPLAGASTETERSHDAPPPPPSPALPPSSIVHFAPTDPTKWKCPKTIEEGRADDARAEFKGPKTIEEGSADDAGAEFKGRDVFGLTREDVRRRFMRLFNKRANMALVFYHKNNPGDLYELVEVSKDDVYDFQDNKRISYLHMNFKAKNVTTGLEKLFFAELALEGDVFDMYGGYHATCCSIVDENCVGGQKHMVYFKEDLPADGYDKDHCYVCDETIKHPIGSSYKAGHCGWGYFVG